MANRTCDYCGKSGAVPITNIFKYGHTNFCPEPAECDIKYTEYLFRFTNATYTPCEYEIETPHCFKPNVEAVEKPFECAQCGTVNNSVRRFHPMLVKYEHTDFCNVEICMFRYKQYLDVINMIDTVYKKPAALQADS
jgi:hypothetical protein